ncbi:MAG TPA: WbqC family protein [Nitrospiria bacterium]|nr:WbqC family protein [Nitrospiria bacterium]
MRVAVHQPQYLPWSGLFDKIDQADLFVVLDNVQYQKNEWQNRNRIKTPQGWRWLTVPVHYAYPQRLREVRVAETGWQRTHWRTLTQSYRKAPHFDRYAPLLEPLYTARWAWLVDLALAGMACLADALGIGWAPRLASEMTLTEEPNQRLIDICRQVGADHYLAGSGSRHYLDLAAFERAGIAVNVQQFSHPVYPQLYPPFETGLTVLDLLFNCGQESLARLRASRGALLEGRLP